MLQLSDSIIALEGLGPKLEQRFNNLGIYRIEHLLFHLPHRYQNKTRFDTLAQAQVGAEALFELSIIQIELRPGRQAQLLLHLEDDQGRLLRVRFFKFTQYQQQGFVRGDLIQCFGELKLGREGLEMHHPEYRLISKGQATLIEPTLTPVYPLTAGVYQNALKKWIDAALETLEHLDVIDVLAPLIGAGLPNLKSALKTLHHPQVGDDLDKIANVEHPAQQRLIIEELCAQQLSLLQLKKSRRQKGQATPFKIEQHLTQQLLTVLPFQLTGAQQRCIGEINQDLSSGYPMHRLLQGDVSSGKTMVAICACLQAIGNHQQAAVMAPTEILAEQHLQEFIRHLEPLGVKIAFLSGSQNSRERGEQLALIERGEAGVIVGTHALFQEQVIFHSLGLVVVDEQHKFGVHQRLSLTQKAQQTPHQLVMTATPIPRSLTMSAYADLDTSVIDELPPGRQATQTIALSNERKAEVVDKITQVCQQNQQVYWVCTLIDESEAMRAESALNSTSYLQENLPDLTVRLIHGKMDKIEKAAIMQAFASGEIDVLVATTVIEVGVNVPNASLMVIENAERLGLAQLHQLRGRVGRGQDQSVCILMYQAPLSQNAIARLDILRQTNDGFKIANKDLELRGPGEILGTQQTGVATLRIADIVRDAHLLKQVRFYSEQLLEIDTSQQQQLIERWVGDSKAQYANI